MKDAVIDAHNKYDGMSVHNLLGVAVCTPFLSDEEIVGLESALRSAVIREASVGTVSITTEPTDDYPCIDTLTLKDNRKHGWMEYDLIPHKETPTIGVDEVKDVGGDA
jgi:hypothetical protein